MISQTVLQIIHVIVFALCIWSLEKEFIIAFLLKKLALQL